MRLFAGAMRKILRQRQALFSRVPAWRLLAKVLLGVRILTPGSERRRLLERMAYCPAVSTIELLVVSWARSGPGAEDASQLANILDMVGHGREATNSAS